jgi:hypothetical protein
MMRLTISHRRDAIETNNKALKWVCLTIGCSTGAVIRFKPSLVEGQQRGEEHFLEFDIVNNQGKVGI